MTQGAFSGKTSFLLTLLFVNNKIEGFVCNL